MCVCSMFMASSRNYEAQKLKCCRLMWIIYNLGMLIMLEVWSSTWVVSTSVVLIAYVEIVGVAEEIAKKKKH